jgi:hypothetical protein
MANIVKIKRSAVADKTPSTSDLELGELALNTYDGNLFFKKDSGTASIVSVATLTGTQTLTNKTLSGATISGAIKDKNNSVGTSGQVLASTVTGVQWVTKDVSTLDSLTDVSISDPQAQQVLKYNGSQWINAAADTNVASAVFAIGAQSDLGSVTDLIIGITEDLGELFVDGDIVLPTFLYNLGPLVVDGIVSLSNLDQSVKADYISYSIIFGF